MELPELSFTQEELAFPSTEEYPKADIERVQARLLEMADAIIGILDAHGIDYMITYGTLLGAVRHKGFIPWDDDFDIFLFDEDYEHALEVLRAELPSDMVVHDGKNDPIYWPYWARVRDLNSETYAVLYPKDNAYQYRGINFDLYPLERIKKSHARQTVIEHNIDYFRKICRAGFISEAERDEKVAALTKELDELNAVASDTDEEIYQYCDWYEVEDDSELFPLVEYEFEGRVFKGPADFDAALRKMYGDYLALPAYEDRKPHYTWVKFNDETETN